MTNSYLKEQIDVERKNKKKDGVEKREFVRTNFGPEEDDGTYKAYRSMVDRKKNDMREGLLQQIKEKQENTDHVKLQERLEDIEALATAAQVMENERKEYLNKDYKSKHLF